MSNDPTKKADGPGLSPDGSLRTEEENVLTAGEVPARDIPTGRFSRFFKLSALSAGTSTRYLGQKMKGWFQTPEEKQASLMEAHKKTAEKTVEVMGQLKGAVMKVGQMISLHPEHGILPAELTRAFSRLQSQAPTLPYPSIAAQIERELGKPPEELFASFDPQPMAAASLGQVHAAVLPGGEQVAVKVQYPDIDKTIDSDLWQLRRLIDTTGLIGRRSEAELIFQELRDRLGEELNYVQEAQNIAEFRAFFADDPVLIIPRAFAEYSSSRVLTMERLTGLEFKEVLERHPDQAWRNTLGSHLFRLLLTQMMIFRSLHADPQLGNYRFLDDGRIIMLDLGCVKRFGDAFMEPYLHLVEAAVEEDPERIAQYLADLGVLEPGHPEAMAVILEFCDVIVSPLRASPFRFTTDGGLLKKLKAMAPQFLAHPEIVGHPDMVYLHRTYLGLYFMLTTLEAELNWWQMFCEHRERARQMKELEQADVGSSSPSSSGRQG